MKCKMPSVKGQKHMGYLGHFAKDKYIQKGHNDVEDSYTTGRKIAENLRRIAQTHNTEAAETQQQSDSRCSKLQGDAAQNCYDDARAARARQSQQKK